jgi:hypothetical protein
MRLPVREVAAAMDRRKEELAACADWTRKPGMLHCVVCKWPCTEPGWHLDESLTKAHTCLLCELTWQASVMQVFQALVNLGDVSGERVVSRDAASKTLEVAKAPPNAPYTVEM